MAGLGRYLPLSLRDEGDESGVTGDWSPVLAECLDRLVEVLGALPSRGWDEPAGPGGGTVRSVVAELVERCEAPPRVTLAGLLGRALPPSDDRPAPAAPPAADLTVRLRSASRALRAPGRRSRTGVALLTRAVLAVYDVSALHGPPPALPRLATGAVALARATAAPLPIRAVIRGRTLVATDDGWRFGTGKELSGTAREQILFLFGRSGTVPGG